MADCQRMTKRVAMSDTGNKEGSAPLSDGMQIHPVFVAMRRSLAVLVTISVLASFYFAKDLILPVLLGVLIALTLSPLTRFLVKLGIPYAASAVLLILLTTFLFMSAVIFSAGTVNSWVASAPEIGQTLKAKLSGLSGTLADVREASEQVEDMAVADGDVPVQEVVIKQPSLIDSAVSTFTSLATTVVVALILATFLLASGDMFYIKLVQSFRTLSDKKRALTAVYDIERKVSRYLLTITVINAGLGVAIGFALWALGLDYPYIWGIAAFLLNFVPFVGGVVGSVLVGVTAIVQFDSLYYAMAAPIIYQVLTGIEGQFVTPTLVGRRLEMNTVAVFLTVVIWGWLWGIPGALVAVPFLVVFKVICENFEGLATFANFLGKSPDKTDSMEQKAETAL